MLINLFHLLRVLGFPCCLFLLIWILCLVKEVRTGEYITILFRFHAVKRHLNETAKMVGTANNKGIAEGDDTKIALTDITGMSPADKTRRKCHIEFQTTEDGSCGHSCEEAIRNVNRTHYGLGDSPTERRCSSLQGKVKQILRLNSFVNMKIMLAPTYIKDGLVWLNDQRVLE